MKKVRLLMTLISCLFPVKAFTAVEILNLGPVGNMLLENSVDHDRLSSVLAARNLENIEWKEINFNEATETLDLTDFDNHTVSINFDEISVAQPNMDN